jgi:hypothetical protein
VKPLDQRKSAAACSSPDTPVGRNREGKCGAPLPKPDRRGCESRRSHRAESEIEFSAGSRHVDLDPSRFQKDTDWDFSSPLEEWISPFLDPQPSISALTGFHPGSMEERDQFLASAAQDERIRLVNHRTDRQPDRDTDEKENEDELG